MSSVIEYNPIIPKNFAPLLKTNKENGTHRIIARGGRYSGKTTTIIQEALEGYITIPGANIVVARADDVKFSKTTFPTVKKELQRFGIAQYCHIPKRTGDIIFKPNGNIIRFVATGGDEHRTKGLDFEKGYVHRFIHDEAQELEHEYEVKGCEKTLLRMLGDTTKWIYIYNPPPFRAEFANVYFPKLIRDGRAIEIYSSWKDIRKLLSQDVVDEILKDKQSDLNYYLYEYMGEVTATNGLVYPQFRREKHCTNIYTHLANGDRVMELILGVDEGSIYDSTCVTPIAIMYSGLAIVLGCFENDPVKTGAQAPSAQSRDLIRYLERLLTKFGFLRYVPRRWNFECAEAGQNLMNQFVADTGGTEDCMPVRNKSIMGDIKRVRSMLQEKVLLFHVDGEPDEDSAEKLMSDIENYVFDEKTNTVKKGQRDDTIDSLEYGTKLIYDMPIQTTMR